MFVMFPTKQSRSSFFWALFPGFLWLCALWLSYCFSGSGFSGSFLSSPSQWPLRADATLFSVSSSSPLMTPVSLGLFTHNCGFRMQTRNSQHMSISSPALTPDVWMWRSIGPSCLVLGGPLRISVLLPELRSSTCCVCVPSLQMALSPILWARDTADSSQFCLPFQCLQLINLQFLSVLSLQHLSILPAPPAPWFLI